LDYEPTNVSHKKKYVFIIDRLKGGVFLCGSEKLVHSYSTSVIFKASLKPSWMDW